MENQIKEMISKISGIDVDELQNDLDLFENGILDSFGSIHLLSELCFNFDIEIDVAEVEREQIKDIDAIVSLVASRKAI